MTYAIYITGGALGGLLALAILAAVLLMLAAGGIIGILRLERSEANVRHRPSKQNSDL